MQSLPSEKILVGATAACVHGLELRREYMEIAVSPTSGVRSQRGLIVRHVTFAPGDVVSVREIRVTSLHRTLRDLCVFESAVEALVAIDMAIRLRRTTKMALDGYVKSAARLPGVGRLRRLLELAAPAESPMETRLRWLLVSRRLPMPEVQVNLHDAERRFVGRADLYYPNARLVIEFDGGNHRERLVSDDRRQNLLINAGYRVLRFTASDLYQRPDLIADHVRGALATPALPRLRDVS